MLTHQYRFASITEIENMIPFERDLFIKMISDDNAIKEETAKLKQQQMEALQNRRF